MTRKKGGTATKAGPKKKGTVQKEHDDDDEVPSTESDKPANGDKPPLSTFRGALKVIDVHTRKKLMKLLTAGQWNLIAQVVDGSQYPGTSVDDVYEIRRFLRSLIQNDDFEAQLKHERMG